MPISMHACVRLVILLQEMPPGMKEKNAKPRAVGQRPTKATKKKLSEIVDDPGLFRTPQAQQASVHIHQLLDLAVARAYKPRAFGVFMERLPPLAANVARQAAEGLEVRLYECLPPISATDKPPSLCI